MGQKLTIRRISELAGVSKSTVARVIGSHPSVSPEAVRRVREVAADLNYNHQPRKRHRREKTSVLDPQKILAAFALVVPDIRSNFYSSLIQGFDAAAGEGGHQVITCNSEDDARKQADIILQLMDKRVAGVAINPTWNLPPPVHQLRRLQATGIPVVQLHCGVPGISAPLIQLPYKGVVSLAAQKTVEQGHRRVALFLGCRDTAGEMYEKGFRAALDKLIAGLSEQLWVHYGHLTAEFASYELELEAALREMLRLPIAERPTAIFTPWDPSAAAIYLILTKWGHSVPGDFSLISEGDSWRADPMNRRLSAVTLDESHTGRLAAGMLDEMRRGDRPIQDKQLLTIPVGWHAGETLGRLA